MYHITMMTNIDDDKNIVILGLGMFLDTSGQRQTSEWHPPSAGRSGPVGAVRLTCSGGAALQHLQQTRLPGW